MFILKHELTHSIEKAGKDFERFIADVEISEAFEEYAKTKTNSQTGENFNSIDEWYNDIIYKYKKAGKTLGGNGISETEAAKREAIADFVGDCLFGGNNAATEKLLNGLKDEERNKFVALVKRIFAKLKEFFGGTEKLSEIERLENEFLAVANKVAEMNAKETEQQKSTTEEGSGVKHSFAEEDIVDLSVDEELIDRINNSDKSAITVMRDYILEKLGGRDIELSDGVMAIVDKNDAQHIGNTSRGEAKKARLAHLEQIIENAEFYNEVDATHNKFNKFRYYEVPVRYKKDVVFVTLNVGKSKYDNKYHLYDLTEPKERNAPNRLIGFGRSAEHSLTKGVSNYSIPKSTETVNKNSSTKKDIKQRQFKIIKETNPMWDDYHTGIRTVDDVRTWEEVLELNDEREGQFVWGDFSREDAEQALKDGKITVYSSYPIKNGVFVSTSYIQAEEYAGGRGGKVYSKTIPLTNVAWINGDEGQYAEVSNLRYSLPENPTPEQIGQALYDHEISMEEYRELIAEANKRAVQASGAIDQGEMVAPPVLLRHRPKMKSPRYMGGYLFCYFFFVNLFHFVLVNFFGCKG